MYIESGKEIFVGSLNGGPDGTFSTTYKFESKWDPDVSTGSEVDGRCQHPIVEGSGTGGFDGATGRADFKDEVTTGQFFYRGHMSSGSHVFQPKCCPGPTQRFPSMALLRAAGP